MQNGEENATYNVFSRLRVGKRKKAGHSSALLWGKRMTQVATTEYQEWP
jgi:hypothetical protein